MHHHCSWETCFDVPTGSPRANGPSTGGLDWGKGAGEHHQYLGLLPWLHWSSPLVRWGGQVLGQIPLRWAAVLSGIRSHTSLSPPRPGPTLWATEEQRPRPVAPEDPLEKALNPTRPLTNTHTFDMSRLFAKCGTKSRHCRPPPSPQPDPSHLTSVHTFCVAFSGLLTMNQLCPLCDIPSGCCSFTGPWTVLPVLLFACCVGSLRSDGRCGRCSCWCRFRVRGAQWLVCWGCDGCGGMCRLRVSGGR